MATMQSIRKAYGALKDGTTVGLANFNSDFKELDVAIVKATNHVECPPKERHLRKIFAATSIARPRADVANCLHALARRLARTHNWTVALKTLIVIHRTLREGDPTFREELITFSQRARVLQISNFKDDSSPIAWDCSAWVRTYALYLEEKLECFRVLKYDVETERLAKPVLGSEKGHTRTRELGTEELLDHLPALQQLLYRLIGCRPEGVASNNYVVQYALALVLKESFKIYCAINDGIINLVDKFFEMPRHEAIKALEIYRRAGQQAGSLSDFYEVCRGLELARNFQFPNLREPPQTFLATMEEYIREAPRVVTLSTEPLEFPERLLLTYKPEEDPVPVPTSAPADDLKPNLDELRSTPSDMEIAPTLPKADMEDLLGLNEMNPNGSEIEESNALALSIVPSSGTTAHSGAVQANGFDPSGWELALVTTTTSAPSVVESNLAGGFDKLTLDSLYDEAAYRQQQQQFYGTSAPNPFLQSDPFFASNQIAAPPAVQMATMAQQHQMSTMMQPNPFAQPIHQQPVAMGAPPNTFADPTGFGAFPVSNPHHQSNPFGSTQLI